MCKQCHVNSHEQYSQNHQSWNLKDIFFTFPKYKTVQYSTIFNVIFFHNLLLS